MIDTTLLHHVAKATVFAAGVGLYCAAAGLFIRACFAFIDKEPLREKATYLILAFIAFWLVCVLFVLPV